MKKIHILHENPEWLIPLSEALDEQRLPYQEWLLDEGTVPFHEAPPEGVFYNRMSASSHTRGHRYAPELTLATLHWLECHGRRILNDHRALHLEISKLAQYHALETAGLRTPHTIAAVGRESLQQAAESLGRTPFILKPNRGGKGLGVQLFHSIPAMLDFVEQLPPEEQPIDGTWLVQEYVQPSEPFITRCEFIGREFFYAVQVDTSEGFELCPADACEVGGDFCPTTEAPNKFRILSGVDDPDLLRGYETVMKDYGIEVAGFEFIRSPNGELFTYDINTNTNYNSRAEQEAQLDITAMQRLATVLGRELDLI